MNRALANATPQLRASCSTLQHTHANATQRQIGQVRRGHTRTCTQTHTTDAFATPLELMHVAPLATRVLVRIDSSPGDHFTGKRSRARAEKGCTIVFVCLCVCVNKWRHTNWANSITAKRAAVIYCAINTKLCASVVLRCCGHRAADMQGNAGSEHFLPGKRCKVLSSINLERKAYLSAGG